MIIIHKPIIRCRLFFAAFCILFRKKTRRTETGCKEKTSYYLTLIVRELGSRANTRKTELKKRSHAPTHTHSHTSNGKNSSSKTRLRPLSIYSTRNTKTSARAQTCKKDTTPFSYEKLPDVYTYMNASYNNTHVYSRRRV